MPRGNYGNVFCSTAASLAIQRAAHEPVDVAGRHLLAGVLINPRGPSIRPLGGWGLLGANGEKFLKSILNRSPRVAALSWRRIEGCPLRENRQSLTKEGTGGGRGAASKPRVVPLGKGEGSCARQAGAPALGALRVSGAGIRRRGSARVYDRGSHNMVTTRLTRRQGMNSLAESRPSPLKWTPPDSRLPADLARLSQGLRVRGGKYVTA